MRWGTRKRGPCHPAKMLRYAQHDTASAAPCGLGILPLCPCFYTGETTAAQPVARSLDRLPYRAARRYHHAR